MSTAPDWILILLADQCLPGGEGTGAVRPSLDIWVHWGTLRQMLPTDTCEVSKILGVSPIGGRRLEHKMQGCIHWLLCSPGHPPGVRGSPCGVGGAVVAAFPQASARSGCQLSGQRKQPLPAATAAEYAAIVRAVLLQSPARV